jgi:hypothetical protein
VEEDAILQELIVCCSGCALLPIHSCWGGTSTPGCLMSCDCAACALVPKDVSDTPSPQPLDSGKRSIHSLHEGTRGAATRLCGASRDGLITSPSPPDPGASASLRPSIASFGWRHVLHLFLSSFPLLAPTLVSVIRLHFFFRRLCSWTSSRLPCAPFNRPSSVGCGRTEASAGDEEGLPR